MTEYHEWNIRQAIHFHTDIEDESVHKSLNNFIEGINLKDDAMITYFFVELIKACYAKGRSDEYKLAMQEQKK